MVATGLSTFSVPAGGGHAFEAPLNGEAGLWLLGSQRMLLCKKGSLVAQRQQTGQCALIAFHSLNSDCFLAIKYVAENRHVLCSFCTIN